jgi:hypothetical protein
MAETWPKDPVDVAAGGAKAVTRVTYADADDPGVNYLLYKNLNPFSQYIHDKLVGNVPAGLASTIDVDISKAVLAWSGQANIGFLHEPNGTTPTLPNVAGFQNGKAEITFGFGHLPNRVAGETNTYFDRAQLTAAFIQLGDPRDVSYWRIEGTTKFDQVYSGDIGIAGTQATLQQIITHEVGHALGLPDNPTDPFSIMYPYATATNQHIDSDDRTAIQALYGAPPGGAQPLIKSPAVDVGDFTPLPYGDTSMTT